MLYDALNTTSTSQAIPGVRNPKRGYNLYLLDAWEEADNELLKNAVTKWSKAKILFEMKARVRTLGTGSTKRQKVLKKFNDALTTETAHPVGRRHGHHVGRARAAHPVGWRQGPTRENLQEAAPDGASAGTGQVQAQVPGASIRRTRQ